MQSVFPKIGFSMEEGTLTEWLVPDGASVTEGQPLYVLESEKSAQEIEAPGTGTLKIIAGVGAVYRVGDVLPANLCLESKHALGGISDQPRADRVGLLAWLFRHYRCTDMVH